MLAIFEEISPYINSLNYEFKVEGSLISNFFSQIKAPLKLTRKVICNFLKGLCNI